MDKETFEILCEFMSPFDDNLFVTLMGDNVDNADEIKECFNHVRHQYGNLFPKEDKFFKPITFIEVKTPELYRGAYDIIINALGSDNHGNIIYIDKHLSKDVINLLSHNTDAVDELDAMLINKYILSIKHSRFIFDLTYTDDEMISRILGGMDLSISEFNYLIMDNMLAIWILSSDDTEFT
jgi:hypothetical protein